MTSSSRIFVKGLPPTLTEDDFKKHFSAKQVITDAKLIPHRRIGYVGFKTPDEAAKAVKYFNKTFMRMSRIGVELARPISDESLPVSRKAQREHTREVQRVEKVAKAAGSSSNSLLKRKRSDMDEPDPKLKEYLGLMLPKSQPRTFSNPPSQDSNMGEPPKKMQAIELLEAESDGEYEMIPRSPKKEPKSKILLFPSTAPTTNVISKVLSKVPGQEQVPTSFSQSENTPLTGIGATDDDWLRSRTNRLLDLIEPTNSRASEQGQEKHSPSPQADKPSPAESKDQGEELTAVDERLNEAEIEEGLDPTFEAIKISGRLFVRNLPYTATEDDLRKYFAAYGDLEEIHLPLDAAGKNKGFILVQFEDPSAAAEAYHNVDGEPFQGRLLHVLPAERKRENKLDEFIIAKLPLKKQRLIKKKAEASSTFNWNSLYMSQDAVNSSIADRLGVSKADLLDPTSADAGVKQAIAETSIIQETKAYFAKNGVDLHAFKKKERGDTTILVKNFPYGMTLDELRKIFEEFGQILRVLMPPAGTTAIVEFTQAPQARAAFSNLAYRRLKDSVLFLEKAPKDLFVGASVDNVSIVQKGGNSADLKISTADLLERDAAITGGDTSTLFIRNLNFETTSTRLTEVFKPLDGFMSARVNTKTNPKKPGHVLSMGFGFVEFRTKAQAQAALVALDGYSLDNHKLVIKASHKGMDAAEERRKEDRAKKLSGRRTKIIIKNLPFEATKKDVRALFGTYGQLRSVRVPKKFDSSARGFAFADFVTAREAENALEALKDTHLLGRRLVLEFASEDPLDAEEEIEKMQKKVGKQVNKVALQKLTGGGRKKFNIEGDENEGDQ